MPRRGKSLSVRQLFRYDYFTMLEQITFLALSLIGLWVGANFLVKGAKDMAQHFGIPHFLIGLTLISIGTSIPEIGVSVAGAFDRLAGIETSGIVIGNKIGSALGQITFIMGCLAFLVPLRMKKEFIYKHGSFLIASILLVFGLAADGYLSQVDGVIALIAYLIYYIFVWVDMPARQKGRPPTMHLIQDIAQVLIGIIIVLLTSDLVVSSSVALADLLNVSQSLVGILIVGLGTGLPELSVAIASFKRKAMGLSMGDLIGSNICDLLLSLGAGTAISGFIVDPINLKFDLPFLFVITVIVLYFLYSGRRISKREGSVLIGIYLLYVIVKIFITG